MASTNNTTSTIPVFVQNQILRADDLNNLVRYFEEQTRLTRIFTIGVGIAKGLDVSFGVNDEGQNVITVSRGMGISSDGLLFEVNQPREFKHYKPGRISKQAFYCPDDKNQGSCGNEAEQQDIWELYSDEEIKTVSDTEPLPDSLNNVNDHALVFVHCEETVGEKSCFNECEQNGIDRFARTRVALVPKSMLENPASNNDDATPPAEPGIVTLNTPPAILRLGQAADNLDLGNIDRWEKLYRSYYNRFAYNGDDTGTLIMQISNAFKQANEGFYKKIKPGGNTDFSQLPIGLINLANLYDTANAANTPLPGVSDIQYCYAYFRDLILAYEAFYKLACGMSIGVSVDQTNDSSSVDRCAFPGYISLGLVKGPDEFLDDCRTGFFPASATQGKIEREERAMVLYERLRDLVVIKNAGNNVLDVSLHTVDTEGDIRITASCTQKSGLGNQAIPFYLKRNNVKTHWNADNPDCDMAEMIPHYDKSDLPGNVLLNKVDTFDFYRIENHLGKNLDDAEGSIEKLREQLNLAFDIRPLLIGPNIEFEDIFTEGKIVFWKELQEVYANTRADILCRIDEWRVGHSDIEMPDLNIFYNTLFGKAKIEFNSAADDFVSPETFISQLDKAIDVTRNLNIQTALILSKCLEEGKALFKTLFDDLNAAIDDIKRSMQFHTFAQAHPGMEHLGGVHRGGTFIVVYAYRFEQAGDREDYQKTYGSLSDEELIVAALAAQEDPKDLAEKFEKIVVADFCLPYFCCAKTPVVRNEIALPDLRIFVGSRFCYNPEAEEPMVIEFNVFPEGGTLSFKKEDNTVIGDVVNNAIAVQTFSIEELMDDGDLSFMNGKITIKIEYFLGSQLVEKEVIFYKKPNANFGMVSREMLFDDNCNWNGLKCILSHNLVEDEIEVAQWSIGDIKTDVSFNENNEDEITHLFQQDDGVYIYENFTIFLDVKNGTCESDGKVEVEICPDPLIVEPKNDCSLTLIAGSTLVESVSCDTAIPAVDPDAEDKTYSLTQGAGDGYVELFPGDAPGGDFTVTLEGELPPDVEINFELNALIQEHCITIGGDKKPVYLFVYDRSIISENLLAVFGNAPQIPTIPGGEKIKLNIAYKFAECRPYTFFIEIKPLLELSIQPSVCFDENTAPVEITAKPEGGLLTYEIDDVVPQTTLYATTPADPVLNLSDVLNGVDFETVVVNLNYSRGTDTASASITVHKKPTTDLFTMIRGVQLFDKNCNWAGFVYLFEHNLNQAEINTDTAVWTFGNTEPVAVDFAASVYEHEFKIEQGVFPNLDVSLFASNDNCENTTLKPITDFCPLALFVTLRNECRFEPEEPQTLGNLVCDFTLESFNDNPREYTLFQQDQGAGFIELMPDFSGGVFEVEQMGENPLELDVNNLITKRCLGSGQQKPIYLFIYDISLIGDNLWSEFGISAESQLPVLENTIQLKITYKLPGCEAIDEFIINVSPLAVRAGGTVEENNASSEAIFEDRQEKQKAILTKLENDAKLARLKAFGQAKDFLDAPADELATVNKDFKKILAALIKNLKTATGQRKTDLHQIATTTLHNYLDKQLRLSPKKMTTATEKLLNNYLPKLKDTGLDLKKVGKSWKPEKPGKALNAKTSVNSLLELLKQ